MIILSMRVPGTVWTRLWYHSGVRSTVLRIVWRFLRAASKQLAIGYCATLGKSRRPTDANECCGIPRLSLSHETSEAS